MRRGSGLKWAAVEQWGASLYGDPCRDCGFGWELTPAQAIASVREVPGAYLAGDLTVAGYDPDLLSRARGYDEISLAGALWSLRWTAIAWAEAAETALAAGLVLQHATRGPQRAGDVAGRGRSQEQHPRRPSPPLGHRPHPARQPRRLGSRA